MAPRDAAAVFDVAVQPQEYVGCVVCGTGPTRIVATEDRYKLPVRTVQCIRCGLQFLNPRMTADGYASFYRHGYRALISLVNKRDVPLSEIEADQWAYAARLAREVAAWIPQGATLLDVGGSTGIVARTFQQRFGCQATVIDPAPDELARATGCRTICASAEDDTPWPSVDVALLCRTVEHLRDPLSVLRRLRAHARLLIVDAMDVDRWPEGWRYKVDHPYAFTRQTFHALVQAAGWQPKQEWIRQGGRYTGLVCHVQE